MKSRPPMVLRYGVVPPERPVVRKPGACESTGCSKPAAIVVEGAQGGAGRYCREHADKLLASRGRYFARPLPSPALDKCHPIEGPHLMPGWVCCICHVYNGTQRSECRNCDHTRCGR